jgi:hypothetical protein
MAEDKLQIQRLELKYIISETTAAGIRDFVSSFLEIDEFGATRPNLSYPVHSLYLDSDDLQLYWETINGTKNRFKLRLRFYDNRPEAPVYFEIKRRMNNCIMKQRGGVRRDSVEWLLAGHIPEAAHLTAQGAKYQVALQRFCQRMSSLRASPKVHISYLREAWVSSNDNSIRVTMDRDIRAEPEYTTRLSTERHNALLESFGHEVVLELKFTGRYPVWFQDMVRVFSLTQCGAAKYVEGVNIIGRHRLIQEAPVRSFDAAYLSAPSDEGFETGESDDTMMQEVS